MPLGAQEIYLLTENGRGHRETRRMDPAFYSANPGRYKMAAMLGAGGTYTFDAVPDNTVHVLDGEEPSDRTGGIPFSAGALTDGNATFDWLKPMPYLMWKAKDRVSVTFTFAKARFVSVVRVCVFAEEHLRRSFIPCVRAISVTGDKGPARTATPIGPWAEVVLNLRTDAVRIDLEGAGGKSAIRLAEVEIWGWPDDAAFGTDIVRNGGFEQGGKADAWGAAKWTPEEKPEHLARASAVRRTGDFALVMRKGETPRILAQNIKPTVAGPYTVQAWVKSSVKDGGAVQVTGGGMPPPYDQSSHFVVTDTWRLLRYSFMLEPNWGGTSLAQELALIGWPLRGDIYWDDVHICAGVPDTEEDLAPKADRFWSAASPTRQTGEVFIERPTHQALGFCWPVEGDYNRNGTVAVTYRRSNDEEWRTAMPLMRQMFEWLGKYGWHPSPNMYAGSVMGLEPGAQYEVHFMLTDPDGGAFERTVTASTRPLPLDKAPGKTVHLYAPGHPDAKKTPAFDDFMAAYAALAPGDTLLVHRGRHGLPRDPARKPLVEPREFTYLVRPKEPNTRRVFTLDKVATANAPIIIRGAGDGAAVLDGDEALELFRLEGADYHYFDGLILQNASTLFVPCRTRGMVVRGCRLRNCRYGVHTGDWACTDFTITDNVFQGQWPPEAWGGHRRAWIGRAAKYGYKSGYEHTLQNIAVQLAGAGHVVSYNRIDGFFDGFSPASGFPPEGMDHPNCAMDIHNNHITYTPDDPIELDAARHNVRCFENLCAYGMMGISVQPILGGPVYIYRNVVYCVAARPYKAHNWPSGVCILNNTSIDSRHFHMGNMWQNTRVLNNLHIATSDSSHALATGPPTPLPSVLDYNAYGSAKPAFLWEFFDHWSRRKVAGGYYESLAAFTKATGYETHGLWGVKLSDLINAPAVDMKAKTLPDLDVRLRPGAPVIDRGVHLPTITGGFSGNAPDIGAYELGSEHHHFGPRRPVPPE